MNPPTSTLLKTKLDEVTSFFANPLSTPIGQLIDTATTPTPTNTASNPHWPLLMEICDHLAVNSPPEMVTNFSKAIKKKLQSKSSTTIDLTVLIVEVAVKNVAENNERFKLCILNRDFLMEFIKVLGTTPPHTQDRILALIQSLYYTFKPNEAITNVYEELVEKGVEFPMIDFDGGMVPLVLEKRKKSQPEENADPILHPVRFKRETKPIQPTERQKTKIRADLAVVTSNLSVLNEFLSDKVIEQEDEPFLEEMQSRLASLLGQIDDDGLISELLEVNDELNNGFLRYSRHVKNKEKSQLPKEPILESTVTSGAIPKRRIPAEAPTPMQASMQPPQMQSSMQPPMQPLMEPLPPIPLQPPLQPSCSPSDFDKFLLERSKK